MENNFRMKRKIANALIAVAVMTVTVGFPSLTAAEEGVSSGNDAILTQELAEAEPVVSERPTPEPAVTEAPEIPTPEPTVTETPEFPTPEPTELPDQGTSVSPTPEAAPPESENTLPEQSDETSPADDGNETSQEQEEVLPPTQEPTQAPETSPVPSSNCSFRYAAPQLRK